MALYRVGDRVRIVNKNKAEKNLLGMGHASCITEWYEKIVTISEVMVETPAGLYRIKEDKEKWAWDDKDFECRAFNCQELLKLLKD
jgi:hypothetical protein